MAAAMPEKPQPTSVFNLLRADIYHNVGAPQLVIGTRAACPSCPRFHDCTVTLVKDGETMRFVCAACRAHDIESDLEVTSMNDMADDGRGVPAAMAPASADKAGVQTTGSVRAPRAHSKAVALHGSKFLKNPLRCDFCLARAESFVFYGLPLGQPCIACERLHRELARSGRRR